MSNSVFDLSLLLAPITPQQAAGKDLRNDPLYYAIKDARAAARAIERQQMQGTSVSAQPDWRKVYQLAIEALTTQTKDLEIAVWLTEALLREQGFAGLREGFQLIRELISHYWDEIYPLPDEDGLVTRLAPLVGLNGEEAEGTLIAPLALVPLTQGRSVGPFALWQYQQAAKHGQRSMVGAVSLEMIATAISETPMEFLRAQVMHLENSITEYQQLNQILAEKSGADAPPSSRITAQLQACLDCLKNVIPTSAPPMIEKVNEEKNSMPEVKTTREQIFQSLLQAADFFRRSEPHSPLPYLLERAVRWGKMPLPQLLQELVKDEQALGQIYRLTGMGT